MGIYLSNYDSGSYRKYVYIKNEPNTIGEKLISLKKIFYGFKDD